MADYTGTLPPSFRPWETTTQTSTTTNKTKSFADVLSRIYSERGHFRDVTSAALHDELTTAAISGGGAGAGAMSPASSSTTTGPTSRSPSPAAPPRDDEARVPPRAEQLAVARREVIGHVMSAQNEALLALDFVSLLLSKEVKAAESTISPVLKQSVPTGTLGMDLWEGMETDPVREEKDALLARGKRLEGLDKATEGLGRAEERLRGTVERERRYWDGILEVRRQGWSVCRIPRERGTLGVRYGFSESLGEFKGRGLAALRMGAGGEVVLDRGLGREGKGLRVKVKKGEDVIGESTVRQTDDEEANVGRRIMTARDSLFEEELWHEAMREGRELGGFGVQIKGDTIVMPFAPAHDPAQTLEIDLVSTDDHINPADPSPLADGIATALRLLLSHTHRLRLEKRSQIPPPISSTKQDRPVANIVRPLLAHLHQNSAVGALTAHLKALVATLSSASIKSSQTTSSPLPVSLNSIDSTASLMSALIAAPSSTTKLTVAAPTLPDLQLTVQTSTAFSSPTYGTAFAFSSAEDTKDAAAAAQTVTSLPDLLELVHIAVAAQLTASAASFFEGWLVDRRGRRIVRPRNLSSGPGEGSEVQVEIMERQAEVVLEVSVDGVHTATWGVQAGESRTWEEVLKNVAGKINR